MPSALQEDSSGGSIGVMLPHPACCASVVPVFNPYCSCNVKQVTIIFVGMWKVAKPPVSNSTSIP